MTSFAPRPGCPLCSIVSAPYPSQLHSPGRSGFFQDGGRNGNAGPTAPPAQVIHKDDKVTVYIEKNNPVSSKGHLVLVLNYHVPSIYMLSSSDVPLLTHMQHLGQFLLNAHINGTLPGQSTSPLPPTSPQPTSPNFSQTAALSSPDPSTKFHIGFIVSPFSDPKIPVSDHVHCHAYAGDMDLAGWWRKLNYSGMGWWSIDDLIAEIREQTTNNRVKSAYPNRTSAPIDQVPDAGARVGLPNGVELPQAAIGVDSPIPSSPLPGPIPAVAVTPDDGGPVTPKVEAAEEGRHTFEDDSGRSSSQGLKKPGGPRGKESPGSGGNIPLAPVSSSPSPSPEPAPAA